MYRADHGACPLLHDATLEAAAQVKADKMAETGIFAHDTRAERLGAGENLYSRWGTGSESILESDESTDAWYLEVELYDFNNPGFNSATGHFT